MKQLLEGRYHLGSTNSVELSILGNFNNTFNQFILLYYYPPGEPEQWTVVTPDNYYDVDCILFDITEEEYFQMSTVWDCPYPIEFIRELQRYMLHDQSNWEEKDQSGEVFDIELEYK